jgi:hypothetical protein
MSPIPDVRGTMINSPITSRDTMSSDGLMTEARDMLLSMVISSYLSTVVFNEEDLRKSIRTVQAVLPAADDSDPAIRNTLAEKENRSNEEDFWDPLLRSRMGKEI